MSDPETDMPPLTRRPERLTLARPRHWRLNQSHRSLPDDNELFSFSGSVGPNGENRREDVIKAQILLGNSGHYRIAGKGAPTGWPGNELFRSIRAFQKEKGLQVDGLLLPPAPQGVDRNGIGETLVTLRADLGDKLAGYTAPTLEEVDAYYESEARFSGVPDDGDKPMPPPWHILLYDGNAKTTQPVGVKLTSSVKPRDIRSDAGPPTPQWRDGQHLAMASAPPVLPIQIAPRPAPPAAPTGPSKPQNPYPHEHPDIKAAGLQLEKLVDTGFGNAAANIKRWYENGQAFVDGLKRADRPMDEAELAAFTPLPGAEPTPPSRPISESDLAVATTPPLVPPKADTKLQGRPAEEQEPAIEQLIPPEMEEWYEGLEPIDQTIIREWIILDANPHGSLGKPSTQLTDLKIAKLIAEEREEMFPELGRAATHLHGSYPDGNQDDPRGRLKQEHIPGPGPGNTGSSRSDLSVGHPDYPDIRGRVNSVSGHWVDIGGGVEMYVHNGKEVTSFSRLIENIKQGTAVTIGKMHDFPDERTWEAHARPMVRLLLAGIRQQAYRAGVLQSAEPLDLPPPGTFD